MAARADALFSADGCHAPTGTPIGLKFWTSAGCRVPGAGCRVPGAGCRVPGAGCRVPKRMGRMGISENFAKPPIHDGRRAKNPKKELLLRSSRNFQGRLILGPRPVLGPVWASENFSKWPKIHNGRHLGGFSGDISGRVCRIGLKFGMWHRDGRWNCF